MQKHAWPLASPWCVPGGRDRQPANYKELAAMQIVADEQTKRNRHNTLVGCYFIARTLSLYTTPKPPTRWQLVAWPGILMEQI